VRSWRSQTPAEARSGAMDRIDPIAASRVDPKSLD
jgi:hypothetical protein